MILVLIAVAAIVALALMFLHEIRSRHRALQAQGRARAEVEHLAQLALRDELTGLPNRRAAEQSREQALALAEREGKLIAVHLIDMDRFKAINDQHGHPVGDAVLREVARRLADCLRASDILARWGGDEFLVIQPMVEQRHDAKLLMQRLAECLRAPIQADGVMIQASISIGYVMYPEEGAVKADLVKRADRAMYQAKRERNGGMGAAA